jgi:hypothetical protein
MAYNAMYTRKLEPRSFTYCLLTGCLFGSFFHPEDAGDMSGLTVRRLLPIYTALHSRRSTLCTVTAVRTSNPNLDI